MKLKKIETNDIKKCHPNQNPCQTDQYYQRLANRLQDCFCSLGKIIEERTAEVMHRGAIMLANYMEDIVADSGQICSNQLTLYKHRLCSLLLQGR